jgi:hypothetical protein
MTITAFDPRTEIQQKKIDRDLVEHSKRFHALMAKPAYSAPTLFQLLLFRFSRTMIHTKANPASIDYQYFASHGWLEADYYYPTNLGVLKRAAGNLLDRMVPTIQKLIA